MDRTRKEARPKAGDVLVVHPHHLGEPERFGEILEVVGEPGHEHFRVRWDDDHETLYYPGSDAIVHRPKKAKKEASRAHAGSKG